MRRWIVLVWLAIAPVGCTAFYQPAPPERVNGLYEQQIRDWQLRVRKEGWSGQVLDGVVEGCLRLAKYKPERRDHWDTPGEFAEKGFQGDCEDIAVFILFTLKRLNYDRNVRILAVKTLMGDHAVVRVELPGGEWKTYETVPVPLGQFDRLFYRPIVEFDLSTVVYYEKAGPAGGFGLGDGKSLSAAAETGGAGQ